MENLDLEFRIKDYAVNQISSDPYSLTAAAGLNYDNPVWQPYL
jgi:hypothetical protein